VRSLKFKLQGGKQTWGLLQKLRGEVSNPQSGGIFCPPNWTRGPGNARGKVIEGDRKNSGTAFEDPRKKNNNWPTNDSGMTSKVRGVLLTLLTKNEKTICTKRKRREKNVYGFDI